jgi:hypothetical protein
MAMNRDTSVGVRGAALVAAWAMAVVHCGSTQDGDAAAAARGEDPGQAQLSLHHQRAPDPSRELVITDTSVVEDPKLTTWAPGKADTDLEGGWSFGRLIDNTLEDCQRTPEGRSRFVLGWLGSWESPQQINGFVVEPRPAIRALIVDPWKQASGCDAAQPDDGCTLDMAKAPFRLLAIVNRPDLRLQADPAAGLPGTGGQGRFVFGALGPAGQALFFTVIFEFQLPTSKQAGAGAWARAWHALGDVPFGPGYNKALHAITRRFTRVGAGGDGESALLQLRTNEAALASAGSDPDNLPSTKLWQLREFVLAVDDQDHVYLSPDTVKQEPDLSLSGSVALGAWASANAAGILAGDYAVPEVFEGAPMLAGASLAPRAFSWQVPGVSPDVAAAFALSTCSGCHVNETGTAFLHIRNRQPGVAAQVSDFLAAQLAPDGPRVADLASLLANDNGKSGPGRDHGGDKHKHKHKHKH